jgi:hypothetical protein
MTVMWVLQLLTTIFLVLAYVLVGYVVDTIVDECCSCYSLLMLMA